VVTAGAELVTLGECLVALVAREPGPLSEVTTFRRFVAGAEANVAVGVARLGHRAAYVGRIGADGFGTAILRQLRGEGVDVSALVVDETAPTALMVRERRLLGPADVLYYRAGSAGSRLGPADVDAAADRGLFDGARWLHLTGITPALSESARAAVERAADLPRSRGMTISLDLNLRRKLWDEEEAAAVLRDLCGRVDVVMGDADEVAAILGCSAADDAGLLAGALLELGPSIAVLKLGAGGAVAIATGAAQIERAGLAVATVVDPVGAGDAFAAGWIASRLEGAEIGEALEVANACGASAVAAEGDMTGLPTRAELDRLRRGGEAGTLR
jgi:2-dehydro-3-deoxygluconokinase